MSIKLKHSSRSLNVKRCHKGQVMYKNSRWPLCLLWYVICITDVSCCIYSDTGGLRDKRCRSTVFFNIASHFAPFLLSSQSKMSVFRLSFIILYRVSCWGQNAAAWCYRKDRMSKRGHRGEAGGRGGGRWSEWSKQKMDEVVDEENENNFKGTQKSSQEEGARRSREGSWG